MYFSGRPYGDIVRQVRIEREHPTARRKGERRIERDTLTFGMNTGIGPARSTACARIRIERPNGAVEGFLDGATPGLGRPSRKIRSVVRDLEEHPVSCCWFRLRRHFSSGYSAPSG